MITPLLPPGDGALDPDGLDRAYGVDASPWRRANFAISVDGAVEVDGRSGGLGGPADRVVFNHLRSMADVVLVGSGTVRAEGYGVVTLDEAALARRARRGQGAKVPVAVLTSRAQLDPGHRLFAEGGRAGEARPLVLTCEAAPAPARAALQAVAEVLVCGDSDVDDEAAMAALEARGLQQVLCEGGPTILTRLVRAGLLDELCLTFAPLLGGPGHAGLGAGDPLPRPANLELAGLLTDDAGTLFARYRVAASEPGAPPE